MDGWRPQHAASKVACLVLSSARLCRSSICPSTTLFKRWVTKKFAHQIVIYKNLFNWLCNIKLHMVIFAVSYVLTNFHVAITDIDCPYGTLWYSWCNFFQVSWCTYWLAIHYISVKCSSTKEFLKYWQGVKLLIITCKCTFLLAHLPEIFAVKW